MTNSKALYLYIHIPFCRKKCFYCDFYSIEFNEKAAQDYISAVIEEISLKKKMLDALKAIYIGGGTPTILRLDLLKKLFKSIKENLTIQRDVEITIEANPESLNKDKILGIRSLDINRISVGIQSLVDRQLKILGRSHTAEKALETIDLLKKAGFKNISVDLIYGIPQNINQKDNKDELLHWQDTLMKIINTEPQHISIYELIIETDTPIYKKIKSKKLVLPDEDLVIDMYHLGKSILEKNGFKHYEISNFSKVGFYCRHNLNYWDSGNYVGIGAGAHSYIGGLRYCNVKDINDYIKSISKGVIPLTESIKLSHADKIKELIFLGLRKTQGINLKKLPPNILAQMKPKIESLINQNLLKRQKNKVMLTKRGLLLSNEVIINLIDTIK
ncbi:MAG: radical SAM family heme chaperone HemW [Thermodesulfovibrionales bacterium]|nr:radical SAM family heme chaperone HemW [Thermodesulfovibrionales bacterium]